jgi:hypothetical protein
MNWLLKKLGYREREYCGDGFSVRIDQIQREVVSVSYTRKAIRLNLDGERIGSKWEGIAVYFPHNLGADQTTPAVADLVTALQSLGYSYVIARLAEIEIVPETERQNAIEELNAMGFDIEVSPDRKQIRQKRRPGAPRSDLQTARDQGPRMTALLEAVHGRRKRLEILAKSKDF